MSQHLTHRDALAGGGHGLQLGVNRTGSLAGLLASSQVENAPGRGAQRRPEAERGASFGQD